MKKPIIVANWKMNLIGLEDKNSTEKIKEQSQNLKNIDIVLCPSFLDMEAIAKILENQKGSNLFLGAQDCFWKLKGNFTSGISPAYLKDIGCDYVILGNSERRRYFQETDEMINQKVQTSLLAGLTPIICVGETMEERKKGIKDYVVLGQISSALKGVNLRAKQKIIIAYEPVWVVGSTQTIEPKEAIYMNKIIIQRMIDLYPLPLVNNNIRFIYGGSVNSNNLRSFFEKGLTDGFLIGKASLETREFINMCGLINGQ
ncbi:triose-phosphate isomerase [bacterium]|nr:triose-phosphate isomerase [bacterium]